LHLCSCREGKASTSAAMSVGPLQSYQRSQKNCLAAVLLPRLTAALGEG
jgi:hypothetical protein